MTTEELQNSLANASDDPAGLAAYVDHADCDLILANLLGIVWPSLKSSGLIPAANCPCVARGGAEKASTRMGLP